MLGDPPNICVNDALGTSFACSPYASPVANGVYDAVALGDFNGDGYMDIVCILIV